MAAERYAPRVLEVQGKRIGPKEKIPDVNGKKFVAVAGKESVQLVEDEKGGIVLSLLDEKDVAMGLSFTLSALLFLGFTHNDETKYCLVEHPSVFPPGRIYLQSDLSLDVTAKRALIEETGIELDFKVELLAIVESTEMGIIRDLVAMFVAKYPGPPPEVVSQSGKKILFLTTKEMENQAMVPLQIISLLKSQ